MFLHILVTSFFEIMQHHKTLHKIHAADYSESAVEWEEWTVEDADTAGGRQWHQLILFVGLKVKEVYNFIITHHSEFSFKIGQHFKVRKNLFRKIWIPNLWCTVLS